MQPVPHVEFTHSDNLVTQSAGALILPISLVKILDENRCRLKTTLLQQCSSLINGFATSNPPCPESRLLGLFFGSQSSLFSLSALLL